MQYMGDVLQGVRHRPKTDSSPSEVRRQIAIIIQRKADQGQRHKVHDKGDQPKHSISNSCSKACHVIHHGIMLFISNWGLHLLYIILLQVVDAFAWWQSIYKAVTITCTQQSSAGTLHCTCCRQTDRSTGAQTYTLHPTCWQPCVLCSESFNDAIGSIAALLHRMSW